MSQSKPKWLKMKTKGAFHSPQNSGKFRLVHHMEQISLVRLEHLGPALKVVHFDLSGHFRWLNRNVPFHLTKLMFSVPLFCILLTRTTTKRALA